MAPPSPDGTHVTTSPFLRYGSLDVRRRDVVFFSHLRWDFVFQRPQHVVSRWARDHRVFFWEEPVVDGSEPFLEVKTRGAVQVVVPHLPAGTEGDVEVLRRLLDEFVAIARLHDPLAWYWTPMMRPFSEHLPFSGVVFDCMDELSAFRFAPPELIAWEGRLMEAADVVFTGGVQLYEAKRHRHRNVHPFPSSVDLEHFGQARRPLADPADQQAIPRPRLGWFGVIDERTDLELLDGIARARPDWQIVMVGPVVKIDPASLPGHPNVHWLGMKGYADLPAYIAHWDVAILPFAHNESTRYISPTKTPEYLAAGKPVVSTSIRDVVRPYGQAGLVWIADGVEAWLAAVEEALAEDPRPRREAADRLLSTMSWDATVARMQSVIEETVLASSLIAAR